MGNVHVSERHFWNVLPFYVLYDFLRSHNKVRQGVPTTQWPSNPFLSFPSLYLPIFPHPVSTNFQRVFVLTLFYWSNVFSMFHVETAGSFCSTIIPDKLPQISHFGIVLTGNSIFNFQSLNSFVEKERKHW